MIEDLLEADANRFWKKVRKEKSCWIWTGAKAGKMRYGIVLTWNRGREMAHRIAYRLTKGPIPKGKKVCHSCDNPLCVNPSHLWLGSFLDNNLDRCLKGRSFDVKGENHPGHKLTEKDVLKIRSSWKFRKITLKSLAEKYGVHISTLHMAIKKKSWSHT